MVNLSNSLVPNFKIKINYLLIFFFFLSLSLSLSFRVEGHDLIVHFNLHFDPQQLEVGTTDLMTVLSSEFVPEESRYLANLTIDPKSLDIKGKHALLTT